MDESARQDLPIEAIPPHGVPQPVTPLLELARALENLRRSMLAFEHEHKELLNTTSPAYRGSAQNLLHYLEFIVSHADLVGLSFVNRESDVHELIEELTARGGKRLGIVLKIETQRAFAQLPALLLTAMRHERVGVMIARGDLAVECGYERFAEVQEEILWICEAAHCPAIWATQVLETLAKAGIPSRAEITDAAMGHRAECVMLNKGPHVEAAARARDDILKRMDAHQSKKSAMLRSLRIATEFGA